MKQSVLANFDMPWIPVMGLILFVVCFVSYIYWTFQSSNKEHFQNASLIPLDKGEIKNESEK